MIDLNEKLIDNKFEELRVSTREEKLQLTRKTNIISCVKAKKIVRKKFDRMSVLLRIVTAFCRVPFLNTALDKLWKILMIRYVMYLGTYEACQIAIKEKEEA